ncbi:MAG: DUF1343 domain-containing protein [Calditrichaeota bacterium]|nr:DUF1343 domain-containing protein [Calditrichota bacterium]
MRRSKAVLFTVLMILPLAAFPQQFPREKVKLGIDVLLSENIDLLEGKRIGLVTNPTGVCSNLTSTIDTLNMRPDVNLVALFGPEHGVRGDRYAGQNISSYTDEKTGLPVWSLYGKTKKPTRRMLQGIDLLIFDMQDIGSRAYTYIYTMARTMEAARENNIPILILDHPDPLGGELVEGPVLKPAFRSFIGLYPIPSVYGMTIGELALYFNSEFKIDADLTVIPVRGWKRSQIFAETGLVWVPTSPHVPCMETPFYIAATGCIGELQTVNVGVGYTLPFQLVGAPWFDASDLAAELNHRHLPGVLFRPAFYRPYYSTLADQNLQGVQIHIIDFKTFKPMLTQIHILVAMKKLYPSQQIFDQARLAMFNKAMGTDFVWKAIVGGQTAGEIYATFENDITNFMTKRKKYLLYKE